MVLRGNNFKEIPLNIVDSSTLLNKIFNEDCLEGMKKIPEKSIDMVLCDMPYGTTACKWDSIIDLEKMWINIKRIIKDDSVIVLTGRQPFTSILITSNLEMYKYNWIWEKENATNFFAAKFQPLDNLEDIMIFSEGGVNSGSINPIKYNPQGIIKIDREIKNSISVGGMVGKYRNCVAVRGKKYTQKYTNYPYKTLKIKRDKKSIHPTQKPIALMEYLIKTYSNEDDVVLDFCMGSGTTAIAAINTNRKFIGFENNKKYYDICLNRINEAYNLSKAV